MLDGADVICSTLSFAGSGVFARMARPLDALVVDEAAQAVEPSCLIPMSLGMKQVSLLPPLLRILIEPHELVPSRTRQHLVRRTIIKAARLCVQCYERLLLWHLQ